MAIENDFLEFLQRPRCKTAILVITIIIFSTLAVTEMLNYDNEFLHNLSLNIFVFWVGRATKSNWDEKK